MKKSPHWTKESHRILESASELDHYNQWLVSLFKPYLGTSILEVGAGLGGIAKHLPQYKQLYLSDLRPDYFKFLRKKFKCQTLQLDIENQSPELLLSKFDSVISSNVFEHIESDQNAFSNSFKLLKPGGYLCLYVPARQEIFGKLDEEMGHFRRYSTQMVAKRARDAGFLVKKVQYKNFLGYFLWWGRGMLLSKIMSSSGSKNKADGLFTKIFDNLFTPILYLEERLNLPFGQSVFLVAQKPSPK